MPFQIIHQDITKMKTDAIVNAAKFGIEGDRAVTYENDEEGVRLNYEVLSEALCQMRCVKERMDGSWKEKIEKRR